MFTFNVVMSCCYFPLKSGIKFIGCTGICAYDIGEHGLYCLLFLSRKMPQGRDFFFFVSFSLVKVPYLTWDVMSIPKASKNNL